MKQVERRISTGRKLFLQLAFTGTVLFGLLSGVHAQGAEDAEKRVQVQQQWNDEHARRLEQQLANAKLVGRTATGGHAVTDEVEVFGGHPVRSIQPLIDQANKHRQNSKDWLYLSLTALAGLGSGLVGRRRLHLVEPDTRLHILLDGPVNTTYQTEAASTGLTPPSRVETTVGNSTYYSNAFFERIAQENAARLGKVANQQQPSPLPVPYLEELAIAA